MSDQMKSKRSSGTHIIPVVMMLRLLVILLIMLLWLWMLLMLILKDCEDGNSPDMNVRVVGDNVLEYR